MRYINLRLTYLLTYISVADSAHLLSLPKTIKINGGVQCT